MTDTPSIPDNGNDDPQGKSGLGSLRPDQGGTNQPGQKPGAPATGGEGAAGAGGPAGFGTGQ